VAQYSVDVDIVSGAVHSVVRRPAAQHPVRGAGITTGDPVVGEVVLGGAEGGKADPVARCGRVLCGAGATAPPVCRRCDGTRPGEVCTAEIRDVRIDDTAVYRGGRGSGGNKSVVSVAGDNEDAAALF
jgi:hypothetical protein